MNWLWKKGGKGQSDRAGGLSEALAAWSRKEGSPRQAAFRLRRRALGPLSSSSRALRTRQRRRPPRQLILPALLPSKQARPERKQSLRICQLRSQRCLPGSKHRVPAAGTARVWRGTVWRPCGRFHAEVAGMKMQVAL